MRISIGWRIKYILRKAGPFCPRRWPVFFLFGLTRLDTRVRSLNTLRLGANIGPGPPLAVFELQDILNKGVELVLPRCVLGSLKFLQDKGRDRIVEDCGDFRVRPPFLEHRDNEVLNGRTKFKRLFRLERHARKSKIIVHLRPYQVVSTWKTLYTPEDVVIKTTKHVEFWLSEMKKIWKNVSTRK